MEKRKRESTDDGDAPKRKSGRQRRPKSFGEDFEEQFSPPKGTPHPTPQQPKATATKPGPSTDPDPMGPDPDAEETVTWPSSPKYWKQLLPRNYRKRLYFFRQRLHFYSKRSFVSVKACR